MAEIDPADRDYVLAAAARIIERSERLRDLAKHLKNESAKLRLELSRARKRSQEAIARAGAPPRQRG